MHDIMWQEGSYLSTKIQQNGMAEQMSDKFSLISAPALVRHASALPQFHSYFKFIGQLGGNL